jgi:hypothetical protein
MPTSRIRRVSGGVRRALVALALVVVGSDGSSGLLDTRPLAAVALSGPAGAASMLPPAQATPSGAPVAHEAPAPLGPPAPSSPLDALVAFASPAPAGTRVSAAGGAALPPALASGLRVHAYAIVSLPLKSRAYAAWGNAPLKIDYPANSAGVPRYVRNGRTYLHPVSAAQQGLRQLATYSRTNKAVYLKRARSIADALIAAGVKADGALWIPYRFDFALHGLRNDVMRAPWYSAMAQGQVLSLASRLYEITGDARYRTAARRIFQSFAIVGRRSRPWVSWVEKRYLWLEEYPGKPPDHTLNGFIFALDGVYDYALVSKSPVAVRVFQGGLTTLRQYLADFRNPGGISRYCLLHSELSLKYHHIHIGQLRELTRMTGDPFFARMARTFVADHP